MGHPLDDVGMAEKAQEAAGIDPGRQQQRARQALAGRERRRIRQVQLTVAQDLADQGEAVGVDAAGGEAEEDVAGGDVGPRQAPGPLDSTDRKAREVVVARLVVARHLGALAADQRAARLAAALGDPRDHLGSLLRHEPRGGVVVEEEQRLGALDDEIVDAHGDQVDAGDTMPPALRQKLELGADAVGRGDQDRVAKAGLLQIEQAAEAADLGAGARPRGAAGERRDGAHQSLAGVDVHPRLAISDSVGRLQRLLCHEAGLG